MRDVHPSDSGTVLYPRKSLRSGFASERFSYWALGLPAEISGPDQDETPTFLAVGGGKGGVGKSIVSANLSATFARMGLRVLVIDVDFGCANLHTHFGVAMPRKSLADFLIKKTMTFNDIILPVPVPGVAFIAGGREEEWGDFLAGNQQNLLPLWQEVFKVKRQQKVDMVIFDLGAGTHGYTMDFFTAAHLGITTVLPEASSIENAYVFLKMALWRIIENVGRRLHALEVARDVQMALAQVSASSIDKGYLHCLKQLKLTYPQFITQLARALMGRNIGLLMNQTRDQGDIDIGTSMEHICQKFFGLQAKSMGSLNFDEAVWKSSRNRRLLVNDFPHSLFTKRLSQVASNAMRILEFQGA